MSKNKSKRYHKQTQQLETPGSFFSKYPTITTNKYWIPKTYKDSVELAIQLYRSGISFNKALDQAYAVANDPNHINRNKLAEHTLKSIANDY